MLGGETYPLALPKWEGGWLVDGYGNFPKIRIVEAGLSLSPLGETGEGFSVRIITCPSRILFLVNQSKRRNFTAQKNCAMK